MRYVWVVERKTKRTGKWLVYLVSESKKSALYDAAYCRKSYYEKGNEFRVVQYFPLR